MGRISRCLCLLAVVGAVHADSRVTVFNGRDLHGWEQKRFAGRTAYMLGTWGGRHALRAESRGTASGLYRKIEVDLRRTPYLHWSWRIDNRLGPADERARAGDDYPARVYVVVSGGLFFWRTQVVNYVWSSNQARGAVWANAFTDHAQMIAVEGSRAPTRQWLRERRNVRRDLHRLLGKDVTHIDAVALMTDTDNTGGSATAYYGELYFSDR